MTPSPRYFSISKSAQRCWTNRSSSTKEFGSRRRSIRSRAVSFPWALLLHVLLDGDGDEVGRGLRGPDALGGDERAGQLVVGTVALQFVAQPFHEAMAA